MSLSGLPEDCRDQSTSHAPGSRGASVTSTALGWLTRCKLLSSSLLSRQGVCVIVRLVQRSSASLGMSRRDRKRMLVRRLRSVLTMDLGAGETSDRDSEVLSLV